MTILQSLQEAQKWKEQEEKEKKKKKEIATRIDIVLELTEIVMNYYII